MILLLLTNKSKTIQLSALHCPSQNMSIVYVDVYAFTHRRLADKMRDIL